MSNMNGGLVSIVIPLFNQESFIVECITSVIEQDYPNIQIIVVDDGSNDSSAECVEKKFGSRVELIRQNNLGPSAAINAGFRVAAGEYIALLGGDDVCTPDRISHQVQTMLSTEHDILFSEPALIDEEGRQLKDDRFPVFYQENGDSVYFLRKLFFDGNFLCAPSAMLKRKVIEQVGAFHCGLIQLQDYDYWLRALANGLSLTLCKHRIVYYRRHRRNLSAENRADAANAETPYILQRILNEGFPGVLRQAFGHILRPGTDMEAPLSEVEKNFLLMAHPLAEVRNAAVTHFLHHVESDASFKDAERYGFNPLQYLYNCCSTETKPV